MTVLANVVLEGLDASKPAAGIEGRQYYATDTKLVYRDNGASWDDVTPTGGSGTVSSIATSGPILGGPITTTGTISFSGTDVNGSGNVVETHLTAPLPVVQGGSGTATPSLVNGANITVSGPWPNQTITATAGGTVTDVTATAPLASSGGATPNITLLGTDVNASGNVVATHLASPLPVLQGGTGTTTPAIIAGTNVTVSGSFPNQTINATASGTVTGVTATAPISSTGGTAPVISLLGTDIDASGNVVGLEAVPLDATTVGTPADQQVITYDLASGKYIAQDLPPVATPTGTNTLISGGGVVWTGGLNFTISAAQYILSGVTYNSPMSNVTLATADPTHDRVDLIVVNSSSAVAVLTGTPGVNPLAPAINPVTQLEVTFVIVPAGSSTPSVTNVDVYLENTEWTSAATANINPASTNNPYQGTKDIEATTAVAGNNVTLTKPSGTLDLSQYASLSFYIRNKASWPNSKSVSIFFLNGSTVVGTAIAFKNGIYGFVQTNVSSYQQIVIPVTAFGTGTNAINKVEFQIAGGGGSIGFYLDNIQIQGGTSGGGGSGGSGTVTSVSTTGPITGGPITTTGTIGFAGTDINSSGNVVATHLPSPLPILQGGTGTTTPGIVAGTNVTVSGSFPNQTVNASSSGGTVTTTGSPASGNLTKFSGTASITSGDLSGDVTTSGTLAATVVKVNGGAVPASAFALASNSSSQPITATRSGNTATIATTSGTLTSGHAAAFDASGNIVDGGAPAGGTVTSVTGSAPIASSGGATPNITCATATTSVLGVVKPDGTTITISSGVISSVAAAGGVFMNGQTTSPPALAGWTWVNQQTNTAKQDQSKAILMTMPSQGPLNWGWLMQTSPSTPYKVQAVFRTWQQNLNTSTSGVYFRDSVGGRVIGFEILAQSGGYSVRVERIVNATTDNGTQITIGINAFPLSGFGAIAPVVYQLRNSGTVLSFDVSLDGENFINIYSESVGTFVTPTQIGFGGINVSTSATNYVNLIGWQVVNNANL